MEWTTNVTTNDPKTEGDYSVCKLLSRIANCLLSIDYYRKLSTNSVFDIYIESRAVIMCQVIIINLIDSLSVVVVICPWPLVLSIVQFSKRLLFCDHHFKIQFRIYFGQILNAKLAKIQNDTYLNQNPNSTQHFSVQRWLYTQQSNYLKKIRAIYFEKIFSWAYLINCNF